MENATKALLIAAAVLVAILIISLGLVVYNRAAETASSAGDLSEYQIQQFNEKFLKYESSNASGTDVNAMLTTVFNHNLAQKEASTCVDVDVDGGGVDDRDVINASPDANTPPEKVDTQYKYTVFCLIDKKTKLVSNIVAKQNN